MTTFQKSMLLWIGGGVVGGAIGRAAGKGNTDVVLGSILGSLLVGSIGDVALEQEQRTGAFSLLPLRRLPSR